MSKILSFQTIVSRDISSKDPHYSKKELNSQLKNCSFNLLFAYYSVLHEFLTRKINLKENITEYKDLLVEYNTLCAFIEQYTIKEVKILTIQGIIEQTAEVIFSPCKNSFKLLEELEEDIHTHLPSSVYGVDVSSDLLCVLSFKKTKTTKKTRLFSLYNSLDNSGLKTIDILPVFSSKNLELHYNTKHVSEVLESLLDKEIDSSSSVVNTLGVLCGINLAQDSNTSIRDLICFHSTHYTIQKIKLNIYGLLKPKKAKFQFSFLADEFDCIKKNQHLVLHKPSNITPEISKQYLYLTGSDARLLYPKARMYMYSLFFHDKINFKLSGKKLSVSLVSSKKKRKEFNLKTLVYNSVRADIDSPQRLYVQQSKILYPNVLPNLYDINESNVFRFLNKKFNIHNLNVLAEQSDDMVFTKIYPELINWKLFLRFYVDSFKEAFLKIKESHPKEAENIQYIFKTKNLDEILIQILDDETLGKFKKHLAHPYTKIVFKDGEIEPCLAFKSAWNIINLKLFLTR